jgi:hypothetical protein
MISFIQLYKIINEKEYLIKSYILRLKKIYQKFNEILIKKFIY